MTVADAIKELQKIGDKSVQLYFDCPDCGKSMTMHKVSICVLVKTKVSHD